MGGREPSGTEGGGHLSLGQRHRGWVQLTCVDVKVEVEGVDG